MSTDRPDQPPVTPEPPTTEIPGPPTTSPPETAPTVEISSEPPSPTVEMASSDPARATVEMARSPAPPPGYAYGWPPAPPSPYQGWVYYSPPAPPTDTTAILGLVFALFFAPAGLVLSIVAMRRTKNSPDRSGYTLALVGTILSAIQIALFVLIMLAWAGMAVSFLTAFGVMWR